jgi:hypothetical protein
VRKIQDGLQPYNAHTGEMIFVETLVNARRLELCNINQFQKFEKEYLSRSEVISERNRFISTPPPPVLESAGPIRQHSTPYVYTGDEWRRQRTNQFDRNMRSRVLRLYDEFINNLLASEFSAGWISDKDALLYVDRFIFKVVDVVGMDLAPAPVSKDPVALQTPAAKARDVLMVDDQSDRTNIDVRKQAYCDCLERTREMKKCNALAAYFHASVEGGECSNDRIREITRHKGKIADLIDRGESIASREGLPLLSMPPKREKQKGARPPRP